MKIKHIIPVITTILMLLINCVAYSYDGLSYDDTVSLIKETMVNSTSDARKESYGNIEFNKCLLSYTVYGTYPVGSLYTMKFSNIDFTSFNYNMSNLGHDYTSFVVLNFDGYFISKYDFNDITTRTVVVNVSGDERAKTLLNAFTHLGELCRVTK